MTSTPSVRGAPNRRQAPIAPDRMALVEDWRAPGGVGMELYVDRVAGDGYLIACGPYAPEQAATVEGATGAGASITWVGTWADKDWSWKNAQAALARMHLADWQSAQRTET